MFDWGYISLLNTNISQFWVYLELHIILWVNTNQIPGKTPTL